jgi:type II secretion system protein N
MRAKRWLYNSACGAGALLLFCISTYLFISDKILEEILSKGLARHGYTCKTTSFGKAFPLGITARNLNIGDERGPLIKINRFDIRVKLLPLLKGSLVLACRATIGEGNISGKIMPLGNQKGELNAGNLRLDELPFITTVTGAQAKGMLNLQGGWQRQKQAVNGQIKLEIKEADLRGIKIGATPLPDAAYKTVQGSLALGGGKAVLTSLTLDGSGLYVRLRGDMPIVSPLENAPLNLTLELMPQPDFLEKQKFVFLLLLKYQTTPGRYEIPIRGVLAKPAI